MATINIRYRFEEVKDVEAFLDDLANLLTRFAWERGVFATGTMEETDAEKDASPSDQER